VSEACTRTKIGAAALTIGSVAVGVFGVAHGVLPEGSGRAVLAYVTDHPHYAGVHFGSIVGVILWTMGVSVLPSVLGRPAASLLAQLGVVGAVVGAAVFVIQFSIDGFGHHTIARRWADAPPAEQESLERIVERLEVLLLGPAFAWTALLWGLPVVLFGLAVALGERFPSWLGWLGVLFGVAVFAVATMRFLQFSVLPDGLVFAASTLGAALWGAALGSVMWLRAPALASSG
jgi:hypothetical protein